MGIGADVKLFRYIFRPQPGGTGFRMAFVLANIHTTTLTLNGLVNGESTPFNSGSTFSFILPLASRGGKIHPAARVAVIEFTGDLPPGLVTRRQSICVLGAPRFESYSVGMTGTFRGLPVKLVQKIDGRPDINGQF